jgi:lysophospholipase L1-like esterase
MSDFAIQDGQTVVFIGDSITDCGRRDQFAPFGNGYVRAAIDLITARYPERNIRHINEGIGGNTIADLRGRWVDDVLAHAPDWVSIKIGINDLHRMLYNPAEPIPPARFEALYREVLTLTRDKSGARLVLVDPFYLSVDDDPESPRGKVMAVLPEYAAIVGKLAEEFGALHVPTQAKFDTQLSYRPSSHFCPEPVHPYLSGHLVIALALLEVLGW